MQQARSQSVAKRNSNKCSQRGPSSGYNNNNNKLALNLLSQLSLKSKGGGWARRISQESKQSPSMV